VSFECVADNLRESFRVIAASRGGGEVRELRGVSIASAGVTFNMFNAAFLSGPVPSDAELAQRIMLPKVHFHQRGLGWAFWVCDDWVASKSRKRMRPAFENHGMRHSTDLPGMIAESLREPVRPLPAMEVRRAFTGTVADAFCCIGATCFHVPLTWFREVFDNGVVWDKFAGYVGYVDGEPVCTAAVVMGGGAAGLYNVATLPGRQRKGYGEAVMRRALEDMRRTHGVERVILQSTPAGLRLYQRMGFETVTRVSVYST
jgi:ribosomal protein S18 acetylase RimI-like enzyme